MLLPLQLNGLNLDSGTIVAVVSGTASGGLTESEVVAGGKTIIITLTNDTWVASGATFNAQRQNIIDGITSAGSETTGWNNEVRDKEVVTAVARTSDTVVTVTLTAAAAYDIAASETITVTVPASALVTSSSAVVASPTFDVTAVEAAAEAFSGGYAAINAYQSELQRRRKREKERAKLLAELEEIEDQAAQEIAVILCEDDAEKERQHDMEVLRSLVSRISRAELEAEFGARVAAAHKRAYEKATYSALEALVREAKRAEEEEDFLLMAIVSMLH